MRRLLSHVVFLAVCLAAVGTIALSSARLSEALRPRLQDILSAQLHAPVHIGRLELYALPPKAVLTEVSIGDAQQPSDIVGPGFGLHASMRRLRLRPHWSSALLARVVLAEMRCDGLQLHVTMPAHTAQGAADKPWHADPRVWHLPIDIYTVAVHDSEVTLQTAEGTVQLHGVNLDALPQRQHLRQLGLTVGEALWRGPHSPFAVALQAQLSVVVQGSLSRPRRVFLENLQLDGMGQNIHASGEADWQDPRGAVQLDAQAKFSGSMPGGQSHNLWPGASGDAELGVRGDWQLPYALVQLAVRAPPVAKTAAAQARLGGRIDQAGLELSEVSLRIGQQRVVHGSATLRFASDWPVQAQLQLQQLNVGQSLAALGLRQASEQIQATVHGPLQLHGTLKQPLVQLRGNLQLTHTQLREAGRGGSGARIVGLRPAQLTLRAQLQPDRLQLQHAELQCDEDVLYAEGHYQPGAHMASGADDGVHLRLWSGSFALEALGAVAGVRYGGNVSLGASVDGPLQHLQVQSSVEVDSLSINDMLIGQSSGTLRFADDRLELAQFRNNRGNGSIVGHGQIDFAAKKPQLQAQLTLERLELTQLLRDVQAPVPLCAALQADIWGQLHLYGPLERPQGRASVHTPALLLAQVPLGATELSVGFAQGQQRLSATLWTHPAHGNLMAQASWADGDRATLAVTAQDVPLNLLHADAHDEGQISLRLALEGPLQALSGTAVADLNRIPKLRGTAAQPAAAPHGGLHLIAHATDGTADLAINILQGAAQAQGTLQMHDDWRLALEGKFTDLEGHAIWDWFPSLAHLTQDFSLRTSGAMALSGPLVAPAAMRARLALSALHARWLQVPVALEHPVILSLAHGRISVPNTAITSQQLRVNIHGSLPLATSAQTQKAADKIDLALRMDGDLSSVRGLVPQLAQARGALHVHLGLQGSYARPKLLGEAELQNGTLRFADGEAALEHVALKVIFSGRGLALTVGQANIGRGKIRAQGELALAEGGWLGPPGTVNLRVDLAQVPFAPYPDLRANFTGSLELTGLLQKLMLHGDLRVQALRYTARLDLNRLVPKRQAPPLKAPWLKLGRPVALNIKLQAKNDAIVSSKVLEAELAADLMLTGSTERLGLLGSVTPLWARARYRDNIFNITHATIDFTDEYRIAPVYSIEGHTRACQMDASVLVQGDQDGYTLSPQGRDEHGSVDPQDVLSCLHFGVRLSDFSGTRGATAGFNDALSSSIDALWTVTGLDDKVRKFLPIRVDELRLTSGWSSINQRTTARVLVGRELGQKLAMRYSRSVEDSSDQAFSLDYTIDPRMMLQGIWLSARDVPVGDFGVDLRLHWELP